LKLEARTPIYVTKDITAEGDISLVDGQTIVIADQAYADAQSRPNGVSASFGTVEALVTLTIPVGKKLTVASGAAVVVGDTSSETTATTKTGVLKIAGGAKLTVNGGATLAVTTESHVLVEKLADNYSPPPGGPAPLDDSGLKLFTGAKVATIGKLGAGVEVIGTATGNSTGSTLIAIETDDATSISAPAAISPDIEVYSDYNVDTGTKEADEIKDEGKKAITDKVAEIEAVSPARITSKASEVATFFSSTNSVVTTVTYTGSETLAAINAPTKTLVIEGTITGQNAAIKVATLEVTTKGKLTTAASGTITVATALTNEGTIDLGADGTITKETGATVTNNGTIKTATDISLVTAAGSGTIVITGTATATDTITLTQKLEIAETTGVLELGEHSITPVDNITKNDGTIKTNSNLSLATTVTGSGTIVITGTVTAGGNITLTQNLEIAETDGVLVLGEYTISPSNKITKNDGTIKTDSDLSLATTRLNLRRGFTMTASCPM
jgi:hypothetical protein